MNTSRNERNEDKSDHKIIENNLNQNDDTLLKHLNNNDHSFFEKYSNNNSHIDDIPKSILNNENSN